LTTIPLERYKISDYKAKGGSSDSGGELYVAAAFFFF
jgi:hypothetical protein